MPVPGPINEVGVVTVAVPSTRKIPAEAGTEARVPRASPVPAAPEPAANPVVREDVREVSAKIAERLERYLKDSGRDVEYRVDADAGATVITVRRSDTGEVVRQFPTEEALAWMRRLNEQSGTFVDALA
jgi:flagellar protein FlaG